MAKGKAIKTSFYVTLTKKKYLSVFTSRSLKTFAKGELLINPNSPIYDKSFGKMTLSF